MLVVCCGMPRSGSTLQFNATWLLLSGTRTGEKLEWLRGDKLDQELGRLTELDGDDRWYALKTHALPLGLRGLASQGRTRLIYSHRDPRDAAVSMRAKFALDTGSAVERIRKSLDIEDFLQQLAPAQHLTQPYHTLLSDLPGAIEEIASFLGLRPEKSLITSIHEELRIERSFQKASSRKVPFEHLRRRLRFLFGRKPIFADERLMLHPGHVSPHLGQIGIWKTELTPSDARFVEVAFSDWMKEKGYLAR